MTQPLAPWGVNPTGFNMKPQAQIQQDLNSSILGQLNSSLDTSPINPFGQAIGVFAGALAELWEVLAVAYEGIDRDNAEDGQLDNIGTLTGTLRPAPTVSQALCSVVLAAGTYAAGSLIASVATPSGAAPTPAPSYGQQFKNAAQVTSLGPVALSGNFNTTGNPSTVPSTQSQVGKVTVGDQVTFGSQSGVNYRVTGVTSSNISIAPAFSATGNASDTSTDNSTSGVLFTALNTGPIIAPGGWLIVIAAPVVGWSDVYNGSAAAPGINLAANTDYRALQQSQLTSQGGSTLAALQAALIALFASPTFGITGASANVVDSPSTKTFAVYVFAGVAATFTGTQLTQIGQTIWANKPAGIPPTGSTSVTIFDSQNIQRVVPFSLVTSIAIYIKITVAFTPSVSSAGTQASVAASIKSAIVFQSLGVTAAGDLLPPGAQGVLVPGGSCFVDPISNAALSVQGVGSVRGLPLIGTGNPPTLSNDLWGANDAAIQAAVDPSNAVKIGANFIGNIITAQITVIDATGASGPF